MDRKVTIGQTTKASDQNYSIKIVSGADYTILDNDKFDEIWLNPTGANRDAVAPDPVNNIGRKLTIENIGDGSYKAIFVPHSTEKILVYSGNEEWELTSFELLQKGDWAQFISDGTNWVQCNTPYWHKFNDPTTGWKVNKIAGWTADQFTPGGLEVTFSEVPTGTKAIRIVIYNQTSSGYVYARKSGDTNISNTPNASQEYSAILLYTAAPPLGVQVVVWLSTDYKAQFAASNVNQDLYISYLLGYFQ